MMLATKVPVISVPYGSQTLQIRATEEDYCYPVYGKDVFVIPCTETRTSCSSKVRLKNIVDFVWEPKYSSGHLVAVHMSGDYIAYALKAVGKSQGIVRIVNRKTEERGLIKGFQSMVLDVSFAAIAKEVLLASMDSKGNLFLHKIEEENDSHRKIICTLVLEVNQEVVLNPGDHHRVIWCPYIPEETLEKGGQNSDDAMKLLVTTHDSKAQLWNVKTVIEKYGVGPHVPSAIQTGYQEIAEHSQPIVDATLSPDGTALAVASLDGDVKFFQVYLVDPTHPRCLHEWKPHNGKPLSCLYFLDDHLNYSPDMEFWKYAITGCDFNQEIKVWSCETWTCLQTITIKAQDPEKCKLKAAIDPSAHYLLLSDIGNKVLYVLQVAQSKDPITACIVTISEFVLPDSLIDFAISDAKVRKVNANYMTINTDDLLANSGNESTDDDEMYINSTVIRMFMVQPKSILQAYVLFDVETKENGVKSEIVCDASGLEDENSDNSAASEINSDPTPVIQSNENVPTPNHNMPPLNLMTPDSFTSPGRVTEASPVNGNFILVTPMPLDSLTPSRVILPDVNHSTEEDEMLELVENHTTPNIKKPEENKDLHSGSSSPSREVEEILSPASKVSKHNTSEHIDFSSFMKSDIQGITKVSAAAHAVSGGIKAFPSINSLPPFSTSSTTTVTAPSTITRLIKVETEKILELPKETTISPFSTLNESTDNLPSTTTWPLIPLDFGQQKLNNSLDQSTVSTSSSTTIINPHPVMSLAAEDSTKLDELTTKFSIIINMLEARDTQIENMSATVNKLKHDVSRHNEADQLRFSTLESSIGGLFEQQSRTYDRSFKKFEADVVRRENEDNDRQTKVLHNLQNSVCERLDASFRTEVKKSLVPALTRSLDPALQKMLNDVNQKLTTTDQVLRDQIPKILQTKAVVDTICQSAATIFQSAVHEAYRRSVNNVLIPQFEKALQNMFEQINNTFSKGTTEYLSALDSHTEKQRKQLDTSRAPFTTQIQGLNDNMQSVKESLKTTLVKELNENLDKAMRGLHDSLMKGIKETVHQEISSGFHDQKNVIEGSVMSIVRSGAATPAPTLDSHVSQSHLLHLIQQGQANAAFQQALSASDLSLVIYVCEKVNPHAIFSANPCPLHQPVLLSLIQQLSADLSSQTDLKYRYLEDAVTNLDATHDVTREHGPAVITSLRKQVQSFLTANPNHRLAKNLKILYMASASLLPGSS